MRIFETGLKDCFIIEPKVFNDQRGYFLESFNELEFERASRIRPHFVQDNQSKSSKGVLRGMHFQIGAYAQAKLVRVARGRVLDVVVDMREDSATFGQHFSIVLDAIDHKQLFVPRGFAHGFIVLEDETIFSYKCDNYYNKEYERGIYFKSESLKIDWKYPEDSIILSEKDKNLPTFKEYFRG